MAQVKEKALAPAGVLEPKTNGVNGLVNGHTEYGYGNTVNGYGRVAADHVCEMASAYVGDRLDGDARAVFEQHLLGCVSCREAIREQLEKLPMEKAARARQHMEKVDEWVLWSMAGEATAAAVRAEMHGKGLSIIYMKDGVIVEELPDGTIVPCADSPIAE